MGVFSNIQNALQVRLNTLTNRPYIAWPNKEFTPIQGNTYIRPTLLAGESTLLNLDLAYSNPGIYQIDIFVPTAKGMNAVLTLVDDVKDHFEADRDLISGTSTIYIKNVSLSSVDRQNAWFRAIVEINYICYQ